jgi:hypothetical protein
MGVDLTLILIYSQIDQCWLPPTRASTVAFDVFDLPRFAGAGTYSHPDSHPDRSTPLLLSILGRGGMRVDLLLCPLQIQCQQLG